MLSLIHISEDAGGDGVDDSLKLGAEAQDDGQHGSNADDQRIVDLAQSLSLIHI